ncbi:MAG: SDR family NAD(P)-dependent oxidoreductase, partial [Bacteroidota bacterium]
MEFSGQVALVTGGTRGIGRAIVEALAARGAHVAFTYRSSVDEANALHEQLTRAGTEALAIQSDASDFEAADAVVQQVTKQWGRIDILVN